MEGNWMSGGPASYFYPNASWQVNPALALHQVHEENSPCFVTSAWMQTLTAFSKRNQVNSH